MQDALYPLRTPDKADKLVAGINAGYKVGHDEPAERAEGIARPAGAPQAPPLIGKRNLCTRETDWASDQGFSRSGQARYLQRVLWRQSSLERVASCGHSLGGYVDNQYRVAPDGRGRHQVTGVATCGSVWSCPVCSVRVAVQRAKELGEGLSEWAEHGTAALLTLTASHSREDGLGDLWENLAGCWTKLTNSRAWRTYQERTGMVAVMADGEGRPVREKHGGTVRATEATYGRAGWHVHFHVLLLFPLQAGDPSWEGDLAPSAFNSHFWAASERVPVIETWQRVVRDAGFEADWQAQDFQPVNLYPEDIEAASNYLVKSGFEVAGGALKEGRRGSRTPFQVLELAVESGDGGDWRLWHEWEQGSHGRRQLVWGRGVRDCLGLGAETTDEQEAEMQDETEGEQIVSRVLLPARVYDRMTPVEWWEFGRAMEQGQAVVDDWLRQLGIGQVPLDPFCDDGLRC